jgi:hypothetical protein
MASTWLNAQLIHLPLPRGEAHPTAQAKAVKGAGGSG